MQRITISVDDDLARDFDDLIQAQGYQSRSEAMRDLVRGSVENSKLADRGAGSGVAALSFVFNHSTRNLAQRLTELGHEHHDLVLSRLNVHLDHDDCLDVMVLRGEAAQVHAFADAVRAERGVRFAEMNFVRVAPNDDHRHETHSHGGHRHLTPVRP